MWKAVKYDSDMDDAVKKAKAQAYNEKIENKLVFMPKEFKTLFFYNKSKQNFNYLLALDFH